MAQVMYHVAPRSARESILAEGLKPGEPEQYPSDDGWRENPAGVYMFADANAAHEHGGGMSDVWEVNSEGLSLRPDEAWSGAMYHPGTIPPNRLRLLSEGTTAKTAAYSDTEPTTEHAPVMYHVTTNGKLNQGTSVGEYPMGTYFFEDLNDARTWAEYFVRNGNPQIMQVNVQGLPLLWDAYGSGECVGGGCSSTGGHAWRYEGDQSVLDAQPGTTAKTGAYYRYPNEPAYTQKFIEQTHGPDEIHGHESDCINPKCQHHWTSEEEHELMQYGEIRCPVCSTMQTIDGGLGNFSDEQKNYGDQPGGRTRAGLSLNDMGHIGQEVVKRAQLPGFKFEHEFHEPNWPVDHLWRDTNDQLHGMEIKTNHSLSQPRFKLGDAAERQKKVQYTAQNGLRQGLIGVRLNFYTNKADVFHRPQFTDTWVGAPSMTHMGTFDFSDLNPFKSPGEVPPPNEMPEERDDELPF